MIAPLRLSELVNQIGNTLEQEYYGETFLVLAETTDVKIYYQKTYAFLKLIEKKGNVISTEIGATIWSNNFGIITKFQKATGQSLEQNLELLLEVEIQFHPRYGLKLSILDIDSSYTLGKLELQKDQTLKLLHSKNPHWVFFSENQYFSQNTRLPLPTVFQNIALITAAGSDGRRDFVHELTNNPWGMDFNIVEFNTQVQGEYAAKNMFNKLKEIELIQKKSPIFDCICIVRGGGSNTDFALFDDYDLNLQIAQTSIPIFTGIGHERNVSIADLMASRSLKTPTKCADFINQNNAYYLSDIIEIQRAIAQAAAVSIEQEKLSIKRTNERVHLALNYFFQNQKMELNYLNDKFNLIHPRNIFQRGFALIRKENKVVSSIKQLNTNDEIAIQLLDGTVNAKITE